MPLKKNLEIRPNDTFIFSRGTFEELCKKYQSARRSRKHTFEFHERTVNTDFAQHLVEYLNKVEW